MEKHVIEFIQNYFEKNVFDKKKTASGKIKNEWKPSWLTKIGDPSSKNIRTNLTIKEIQEELKKIHGVDIEIEAQLRDKFGRAISGHKFDFFLPSENTAIEICLGNIKNEFEKDILKGMLDYRVKKLYIFNREYVTGKNESLFGINWMQKQGSRSIIHLAAENGLQVYPEKLIK